MKLIPHLWIAVFLTGICPGNAGVSDQRPAEIDKVLADLRGVVVQVEKSRSDQMTTQLDMETKVLGIEGRDQMGNRLGVDLDMVANYVSEGLEDISYLKDHWNYLTSSEKNDVGNAQEEIAD